jgi:hypothetical protein
MRMTPNIRYRLEAAFSLSELDLRQCATLFSRSQALMPRSSREVQEHFRPAIGHAWIKAGFALH